MDKQVYTPQPWINVREAIENATRMARATGKDIIIHINDVDFSVNAETKMQEAIALHQEALNKKFMMGKNSKQNVK